VYLAEEIWTVHTDVFDGPLDLLLYLVRRDGVDLRTVSIRPIADSYLAYLERMREMNIAVASDYLVMAATLCHLKSLELMPRKPTLIEEQVEEDPREALARQLEDYEAIKKAAEFLGERPRLNRDVFARDPLDVGEVDRPLIPGTDAFGLLDAYYKLLTRTPEPEPVHEIHRPEVSLEDCCQHILRWISVPEEPVNLRDMLLALPTKGQRVISFIAVLEMCRLQWVRLSQVGHLGEVSVARRDDAHIDLTLIGASMEEEAV